MKVLVTGFNSFIGLSITKTLLREGIKVIGTYHTNSPTLNEELGSVPPLDELIQLDVGEQQTFHLLPPYVDGIIHIAGVSNTEGVPVKQILSCNVTGIHNLLTYGLNSGANRVIYLSSLSVHGNITASSVDHTTPIQDPDLYGATKYLGERLLESKANELPSLAIRLPGVIGPNAHKAWLPVLCKHMLRNQPLEIYNPSGLFNNLIHTSVLGDFLLSLLRMPPWKGFHAFPVGSTNEIQIIEIVDFLKSELATTSQVVFKEAKKNSFLINSDYAKIHFGYKPVSTLESLANYVKDLTSFPP